MAKIKTAELTGPALDWAVAKCEGYIDDSESWMSQPRNYSGTGSWKPSTNWSQGGLIIEREEIELHVLADIVAVEEHPTFKPGDRWEANIWPDSHDIITICGPTPLIAAMRCYVAYKLGDEVEVPEKLCK